MLAEPEVEPVRTRRDIVTVQPTQDIQVTFHHTPYDVPVALDPGPAPVEPAAPVPLGPRPVGRPTEASRRVRAANIAYAAAWPRLQEAYLTQKALWDARMELFREPDFPAFDFPLPDLIYTGRGLADNRANAEFLEGFARTQNVLTCPNEDSLTGDVNLIRLLLAQFPAAWPNIALGGKSEGAQAAARAQLYGPAKKLIFLTYPLIVGLQERYDELLRLEADTDVLFIIGTEDAYAVETHLKDIRARMTARTWWLKIENASHLLETSEGTENSDGKMVNIAGQIAARWNEYRDPALTELFIYRDRNTNNLTWTAWTAPIA